MISSPASTNCTTEGAALTGKLIATKKDEGGGAKPQALASARPTPDFCNREAENYLFPLLKAPSFKCTSYTG